jgi:tartrate dehydrogenase/decarboxylase/D-malate dehydrogenase
MAVQEAVFTRTGVTRVAEYAVAQARTRRGLVTSATKSNGIIHTMPFWDEVVAEVVERAGDVTLDKVLVDALAARVVLKPLSLDVIVASNLFGDILSDLAAAVAGSIGVAPSGNINPPRTTRRCSSRFTGRPRTSPVRASRTRSARCGLRR